MSERPGDPGSRGEIGALTGLRGVLALWVVLLHIAIGLEQLGRSVEGRLGTAIANIAFSGPLAVDGFFILSGFVLAHAHGAEFSRGIGFSDAMRFLTLRIARIWPVHAAVLLAYGLAVAAGVQWPTDGCGNPLNRSAHCDRFSIGELLRQIFLVQAWGIDPVIGWNFVSWSISSEWLVYLVFPVLALGVARLGAAAAGVLCVVLVLAVVMAGRHLLPQFHGVNDDYGLLRAVPEFAAGVLAYRALSGSSTLGVPWGSVATAAGFAVIGLVTTGAWPQLAVAGLALIVPALAAEAGSASARLLSSRPLLWLGRISYSVYMAHVLVLELNGFVLKRFIRGDVMRTDLQLCGIIVLLVVEVLVVGLVLHRTVEEPARRWARLRLHRDTLR